MYVDIASIVASARTLTERINDHHEAINHGTQSLTSCDRIERWQQVVSGGESEFFQRRLNWDGIKRDQIAHVLTLAPLSQLDSFPSWSRVLLRVIEQSQTADDKHFRYEEYSPFLEDRPVPFEALLMPFILVGREMLLEQLGQSQLNDQVLPLSVLSKDAYLALENSLLWRLHQVVGRTFMLEFSSTRTFGKNFLSTLVTNHAVGLTSEYNEFVKFHLTDGLQSIFHKYPVLAKLASIQVEFWVASAFKFISRLVHDLPEISRLFSLKLENTDQQSSTTKVKRIRADLSDLHHCGQSVIACELESGQKLVYKPKNLALQEKYNNLLHWINANSDFYDLKVPRMLSRENYGWVEYIETLPCKDVQAIKRFYERAGMILCLTSILGGTDYHSENLIAHGENLVLIDIETLMYHHPKSMSSKENQHLMNDLDNPDKSLWFSLLNTGMLPGWELSQDRRSAIDQTGLGGFEEEAISHSFATWININTDQMSLTYQSRTLPRQRNVPHIEDQYFNPCDYINEIISGFKEMYRFFLDSRHILLHRTSLLSDFQGQPTRFVFRPTRVYDHAISASLKPHLLTDGADRSIELEILARSFLWTETKSDTWPIFYHEIASLEQLDIPYFYAQSHSKNIVLSQKQVIHDYFLRSGYEQTIRNLESLSLKNMLKQVDIIKGVFYARNALTSTSAAKYPLSDEHKLFFNYADPLPHLLSSAENIASKILDSAIPIKDGVTWRGLCFIHTAERFRFTYLGQNLYSGVCGTALFLSALYSINHDEQLKEATLAAVRPIRKRFYTFLENPNKIQNFQPDLGAAIGIGSILYSFAKMGKYLRDPSLNEDIRLVLELLNTDLIHTDQQYDIVGGSAGLILSLLSLMERTNEFPESEILPKVIQCGNHLIENRVTTEYEYRAWKSFSDTPLTGFSHGSAGIAYALAKLYHWTKDQAYLNAALEAIAYETSVYSASARNWPDFRNQSRQTKPLSFAFSWCHGAPGIGLARLGCLPILDSSEVLDDIENAIQQTLNLGLTEIDNLCCGNFSRLEFLQVASEKLDRPNLRTIALQQASYLISKSDREGGFKLLSNVPRDVFSPNFFQGAAGIGYELLRLAYPEKLASVLLWS